MMQCNACHASGALCEVLLVSKAHASGRHAHAGLTEAIFILSV